MVVRKREFDGGMLIVVENGGLGGGDIVIVEI